MSQTFKIVIYGPESTGKTTLSKYLAQYFSTDWIPEFARIYLEQKLNSHEIGNTICPEEDLLPIVEGQILQEDAINTSNKIIFLDTNPLETLVYAKYYFQKDFPWLEDIISKRKYDYYLLTDISVNWEADPLRDKPNDRQNIFNLFKNELDERKLPYAIVTDINHKRFENAISIVKNLGF
jgi:HTH-type transcriptional regulator, transcriptional repressor of NAD biosynthesis genes